MTTLEKMFMPIREFSEAETLNWLFVISGVNCGHMQLLYMTCRLGNKTHLPFSTPKGKTMQFWWKKYPPKSRQTIEIARCIQRQTLLRYQPLKQYNCRRKHSRRLSFVRRFPSSSNTYFGAATGNWSVLLKAKGVESIWQRTPVTIYAPTAFLDQ